MVVSGKEQDKDDNNVLVENQHEVSDSQKNTVYLNESDVGKSQIAEILEHPTIGRFFDSRDQKIKNDYEIKVEQNRNTKYHLETQRMHVKYSLWVAILLIGLIFLFLFVALFTGHSAAWGGVAISPLLLAILPKIIETIFKNKE